MKKITLLFLMVFTALIYQVQGQILFDYETPSTSGGFATWGDSGFAQIVNPSQTGINTSANVGEFSHAGNDWYHGIQSDGPLSNFDFTATPTFKMKVWVDEPVQVILKLQNDPDWEQNTELSYEVSEAETSQWIQLVFNFSTVTATNYNRVVLYFDGGNSIPSGAGHKYYFDDIEKSNTIPAPTCTDGVMNGDETAIDCGGTTCDACPPLLADFNFNFDTPTPLVAAESATFNDDATNTVTDGINSSVNVGEIAEINSSWWSQLAYQYNDGIDLSTGDRGFSIKVKGPRELPVTIKVEGSEEHSVTVNYTTPNVWQKLDFDFTSFSTNTNTKIAVFFDIQVNGDVVTGANLNIFQVDDFVFGQYSTLLSTEDFVIEGLNIYPNPTSDSWNISTKDQVINSIEILDLLGRTVKSIQPNELSVIVETSNLPVGVYVTKISTELGTTSKKLIKQ